MNQTNQTNQPTPSPAPRFDPLMNPYAAPRALPAAVAPSTGYGDRAREHAYMKRGRFGAMLYVVIAFLAEAALVAVPFHFAGLWLGDRVDFGALPTLMTLSGAAVGLTFAYFVFRDRWRCIEAFSSRFCAGIMNVSLLYVPIVAFVYANVRGAQKLSGR